MTSKYAYGALVLAKAVYGEIRRALPARSMTPRQMSQMTPPIRFPVCVLHRQLHRQRKAKYDEQIVLNFSPANCAQVERSRGRDLEGRHNNETTG